MRKTIDERVCELENREIDDSRHKEIKVLKNRIEKIEEILESLGYYIPNQNAPVIRKILAPENVIS